MEPPIATLDYGVPTLFFRRWAPLFLAIIASLGAGACGQMSSGAAPNQQPAAQSKIVLVPNTIDFSVVLLGQKNTQTVKLTNSGPDKIQITSVHIAGAGLSINGLTLPFSLEPIASRVFNIEFAPTSAGTVEGTLTIDSSVANSLTFIVKGVGTKALPQPTPGPESDHKVSLMWDASPGEVRGYNVYRSSGLNGPYAKLTAAPLSGLGFKDSEVGSGQEYFYVVTSVNHGGQESSHSQQVSATIPNP